MGAIIFTATDIVSRGCTMTDSTEKDTTDSAPKMGAAGNAAQAGPAGNAAQTGPAGSAAKTGAAGGAAQKDTAGSAQGNDTTGSAQETGAMAGATKAWLWASVAMALIGACLLFPIGPAVANVVFVIVKLGMIGGLAMLLLRNRSGFSLWVICSGLAIVMTAIKWAIVGHVTFLFIGSMFVDVIMPVVAWRLLRKDGILRSASKGV